MQYMYHVILDSYITASYWAQKLSTLPFMYFAIYKKSVEYCAWIVNIEIYDCLSKLQCSLVSGIMSQWKQQQVLGCLIYQILQYIPLNNTYSLMIHGPL